MSEQSKTTTVENVLNSSIKPIYYQLDIVASKVRGDSISTRAVEASKAMLDQAKSLILEQYDKEVDDYNTLCDEIEKIELELETKKLELSNLKLTKEKEISDLIKKQSNDTLKLKEELGSKIKEHEETIKKLKTELESAKIDELKNASESEDAKASIAILEITIKKYNAELKRLKEMQPERLSARLATQRKSIDEKNKSIELQRKQIADLKREYLLANKERSTLIKENALINDRLENVYEHIKSVSGSLINKKRYIKKGSEISFSIYIFPYGIKNSVEEEEIINDLNWSIELKSNLGINLTVAVTSMLAPVLPLCEEFIDEFPDDLILDMKEFIIDKCQSSHPKLVDRVQWAKEQKIDEDMAIEENLAECLKKLDYTDYYSVISIPKMVMLRKLKNEHPKTSKKLNQKSIDELYSILEKKIQDWNEKNL